MDQTDLLDALPVAVYTTDGEGRTPAIRFFENEDLAILT